MAATYLWLKWADLYLFPAFVCFAIGAVFCLIDFHRLVTKLSNGTAPMAYARCASANLFFIMFGLISASAFALSDIYESATDLRSVYVKAVGIGLVMPAAIRSKWFSHDNIKFGFEQFYDVFIIWAAGNYKQKVVQQQENLSYILAQAANDTHFDEDIVRFVRRIIEHRDTSYKRRFDKAVDDLAGPDHDLERRRAFLIGLCMEYTGIEIIRKYCAARQVRSSGPSDDDRGG